MLSYRHSFHAGNFADVLKHLILQRILAHLSKKEAPFCCVDTHAGAGGYDLNHAYALKNKEFEQGIGKLWHRDDLPSCMTEYIRLIKTFNRENKLARYPGSPLLIQGSLRLKDRLFCYELHSTDIELLSKAIKRDPRVNVLHADGLEVSLKLLPPSERRGLVLIDPSYEIKTDYTAVVAALKKMHHRFATGIFALWYPVVDRKRSEALEQAIKATGIKNIQLFELGVTADDTLPGMTASGLVVINPPWILMAEMRNALPWLAETLGISGAGHYRIEQLVAE
ncbi:MAG: 23S rRNA (adenine(2030)-N(6))-methyltransferase RlmJ [Methylococcaceae bacterium]|nr:23S rRNA (adenine(2030)-N(6))-methyltransferase RlmJ [Methylococcaceae bacterium]